MSLFFYFFNGHCKFLKFKTYYYYTIIFNNESHTFKRVNHILVRLTLCFS